MIESDPQRQASVKWDLSVRKRGGAVACEAPGGSVLQNARYFFYTARLLGRGATYNIMMETKIFSSRATIGRLCNSLEP